MNFFNLFFNKKYGSRYLVINIILTILPIVHSIILKNRSWINSLILFYVYFFSYIFAYISYKQNKKINQHIDPNITLKAISFILAMLISVLCYLFVPLKKDEISSIYIFAYGVFSLFTLYKFIIIDWVKDCTTWKDKIKQIILLISGEYHNSNFKVVIKCIDFITLALILINISLLAYIYHFYHMIF